MFRAVALRTFIFSAAVAFPIVAFAWTGPTAAPPNNNVSAPVNVGSAGQVKAGDFSTQGKLGAGTVSPSASYQLDVYKSSWKGYFHGSDGGISIGPANSSWAHIYSDAGNAQPFIFNTDIYTTTNGFSSYDSDLLLKRAGTTKVTIGSSAVTIGGGSSSNWAQLNIPGTSGSVASINAAGSIYSYDKICVGNASGYCNGVGGVVILGTGVKFPDGTTQTTAAASSNDTLDTVTARGATANRPIQAHRYNDDDSNYYVDSNTWSRMVAIDLNQLNVGIVYDRDNTGYYVDPNSTSRMYRIDQDYMYDANNYGYYLDLNNNSRMNGVTADNVYSYGWMQTGGDIYDGAIGMWVSQLRLSQQLGATYYYGATSCPAGAIMVGVENGTGYGYAFVTLGVNDGGIAQGEVYIPDIQVVGAYCRNINY